MEIIVVPFTIEPIPDSQGLRIKTIDPWGVMVSSRDPEAAKWYFETTTQRLLTLLDDFKHRGAGFGTHTSPDWDQALKDGSGTYAVSALTASEVRMFMSDAVPVLRSAKELVVEHWASPDKKPFILVRDEKDAVDRWFVDCINSELAAPTTKQ